MTVLQSNAMTGMDTLGMAESGWGLSAEALQHAQPAGLLLGPWQTDRSGHRLEPQRPQCPQHGPPRCEMHFSFFFPTCPNT